MFRSKFISPILVCILLPFIHGTVYGQDLVVGQDEVLTKNVAGNLIITNGARVTATRILVEGDVTVEDSASLYGEGLKIEGNLLARQANNVVLRKHLKRRSHVIGNVRINRSTGNLRMLEARIGGDILFDENFARDIVVRDSFLSGSVQVFENVIDRTIKFNGNIGWGSFQLHANDPEPRLRDNFLDQPVAQGSYIEVKARGRQGEEQFELRIDQQVVGRWTTGTMDQVFRFKSNGNVEDDQVRIEYVNDKAGPRHRLIVDHLSIDDSIFQTEAPTVYSTGTWLPENGVTWGFRQSETLHVNGYFQYGTKQILNEVLPDGWAFNLFNDGRDVRLGTFDVDENSAIRFRFGSAGVIGEIEDAPTGRSLLAPSYHGELSDRVFQWTMWELGYTAKHDVHSLPDFEDRYNITQAGRASGSLHGTVEVDLDNQNGELNVWSVADRQWKSELQPFVQGSIHALTRTSVLDGGALLVRRVVRVGTTTVNGQEVIIDNPYFEAWSPFSDRAFDSMALSIDDQGDPDYWFADSRDIPHYPHWAANETRGWAVVYDRRRLSTGTSLAVVFGIDQGHVHLADGTVTDPRRFIFNSMDFSGGLAVLPGLLTDRIPSGSLIDQSYLLVPMQGIDSKTGGLLDTLSARLPAPQVYHPGAVLDDELSDIAKRLEDLASEPRTATDNLGLLVWP